MIHKRLYETIQESGVDKAALIDFLSANCKEYTFPESTLLIIALALERKMTQIYQNSCSIRKLTFDPSKREPDDSQREIRAYDVIAAMDMDSSIESYKIQKACLDESLKKPQGLISR